MKSFFENPVMREARDRQADGTVTWQFVNEVYMPEILRLVQDGQIRLAEHTHEGMRFELGRGIYVKKTIKGASVERPSDADLHDVTIGSAGLYPDWWHEESPSSDVNDSGSPVKDWYLEVAIFDPDSGDVIPIDRCRITADKVWVAAVAIADGYVPHTSQETVDQCRRLVYVGAEACDFDQISADQVLQTVVLGYPMFA